MAQFASQVWERYVEEAREAGCLSPVKGPRKYIACAVRATANNLHVFDRMVGWWNSMASGSWATLGPKQLSSDWSDGTLRGTSGRVWLGTAPVNSARTTVEVEKLGGRVPTEVVVCASRDDGTTRELGRFRFDQGTQNVGQTLRASFANLEADLLAAKVDAKGVDPLARFEYRIRLVNQPHRYNLGPVTGFADLHVHQAGELGFGGNQLWGSHVGPPAQALAEDGIAATVEQPLLTGPVQWLLGLHSFPGLLVSEGDVRHGGGHPQYDRWPHFNDVSHQQVHEDWLREAHAGGLSLIVVSAVNFEGACYALKAMYPRPNDRHGCRDMENVRRQIEALIAMDEDQDWYEIVVDPWHARKVIHEGKLAVVISLEASHLLPLDEGDFIAQLDKLQALGLRTLQLAHETDSRFAGAAPHRSLFEVFQALKWLPTPQGTGFRLDPNGKNRIGLKPAGRDLVDAMVQRHMLIDVAHLSEQAVYDVFQTMANRHSHYPIYDSHTRFEAVLSTEDRRLQREFLTTDEQIRFFRETGGMIGLRTGQNAIRSLNPAGTVANDCDGSAKSFAQLVEYGQRAGVAMALGSDLNGFINQLGPRFGPEACPAAESNEVATQRSLQDLQIRDRCERQGARPDQRRDFATEGLRHVGYLPALISDLEAMGTPGVDILKSSAEAFLQMWERAWDPDRTRVLPNDNRAQRIADLVPDWELCAEEMDDDAGSGGGPLQVSGGKEGVSADVCDGRNLWSAVHPAARSFLHPPDVYERESEPRPGMHPTVSELRIQGLVDDGGSSCTHPLGTAPNPSAPDRDAGEKLQQRVAAMSPQEMQALAERMMKSGQGPPTLERMLKALEAEPMVDSLLDRGTLIHVFSPNALFWQRSLTGPPKQGGLQALWGGSQQGETPVVAWDHSGIGGWQANSGAHAIIIIPDVPPGELEEGTTYPAVGVMQYSRGEGVLKRSRRNTTPQSSGIWQGLEGWVEQVLPETDHEPYNFKGTVTIEGRTEVAIRGTFSLSGAALYGREECPPNPQNLASVNAKCQAEQRKGTVRITGWFEVPAPGR